MMAQNNDILIQNASVNKTNSYVEALSLSHISFIIDVITVTIKTVWIECGGGGSYIVLVIVNIF